MNVQSSIIWELALYRFELGHNAAEVTKNILCMKVKGAVDYSIVTRLFKEFCLGYKGLIYMARSCRLKTVDSEAMLLANPVSSFGEHQAS